MISHQNVAKAIFIVTALGLICLSIREIISSSLTPASPLTIFEYTGGILVALFVGIFSKKQRPLCLFLAAELIFFLLGELYGLKLFYVLCIAFCVVLILYICTRKSEA